MFVKKDDNIVLENNERIYDFLNNLDDYKEIILKLTDPNDLEKGDFDLSIDEPIIDDEREICENYKRFIEDFLEKRKSILEDIEKEYEHNKKNINNEEGN